MSVRHHQENQQPTIHPSQLCSCSARSFPNSAKGIGEKIRGFKSAMKEEEKPANVKPVIAGD